MLCVNNYTQKYIDECRSRVAAQVSAYQTLVVAVRNQAATDVPLLNAAIEAFEPHFFNNMALTLECYFVHRARAIEKKDGNPLNEVRMLCNSMVNNNNRMCADKTIKFDPAKSVLKYQIGDEIRLNEADFIRLSSAYFAEIESKYL
ncbi:hypothetical protein [Methyloglobulus sp.]|uniref:hypothetical protein n=1 Tax=Methyloglobulus sp. TaxID=2518622 RepID=UPI003988C867